MEEQRDVAPECTRARNEFPGYLYGEILPETGSALEQHLETCPACRLELERLRETRGALDRWILPASGDDPRALAAAVRALAGADAVVTSTRPSLEPGRFPRRRWTNLSARLLGVAAGLLFALCLLSTEASVGQGRVELSFALPGRRPVAPVEPSSPVLSEDRIRSIAAQEVSTRAASMERSQLELSRMTREELYQEIVGLSQAVDRALTENQRLYDERLTDIRQAAETSDLAQRRAISDLARIIRPEYIRPVSNR